MKKHIILLLLLGISTIYAQDKLTSGRLVFKQKNSIRELPNDTIWFSPSVVRTTCDYFDLDKKLDYYRLDNGDTVCLQKEAYEKEAMRGVKKLKTFFYDKDTLTLAGIKCKKAVVRLQMQNDSIYEYVVYYSPRVGSKKTNYYPIYRDIPGIPLYISIGNEEGSVKLIEYKSLNPKDLYIPKLSDGFMFQWKKEKRKNKKEPQ